MSFLPDRLYHGTAHRYLAAILAEGISPREHRKSRGNWRHTVTSNKAHTYVTSSYPLYFAHASARVTEPGVVIEFDPSRLDATKWRPDEDFLEQAARGKDHLPAEWDMKRRNRYYREHAHEYEPAPSLQHLGTVAYAGTIPPAAITRIAVIENTTMRRLILSGFDPLIVLANYRFLGKSYEHSARWLMDETVPPASDVFGDQSWPDRAGLAVYTPEELRERAVTP